MIIETITVIKASEGMILTDGETYGKKVFLAEGRSPDDFKEITQEEYSHIMKEAEGDGGLC